MRNVQLKVLYLSEKTKLKSFQRGCIELHAHDHEVCHSTEFETGCLTYCCSDLCNTDEAIPKHRDRIKEQTCYQRVGKN